MPAASAAAWLADRRLATSAWMSCVLNRTLRPSLTRGRSPRSANPKMLDLLKFSITIASLVVTQDRLCRRLTHDL